MSKRALSEMGSTDRSSPSKSRTDEPAPKRPKVNVSGEKVEADSAECEFCSQRAKVGNQSGSEELLAVDDSIVIDALQLQKKQQHIATLANAVAHFKVPRVLVALITDYLYADDSTVVDERQLQRKQQYIDGLQHVAALYAVPAKVLHLVTGYLYPDCATDEELRKCGVDHLAYFKQLRRCFKKDEKLGFGDYHTLGLKLRTATDVWNEEVLDMYCAGKDLLSHLTECRSLSMWRTLLCDLPQSDVFELLMQSEFFLLSVAADIEKDAVDGVPLDTRRFALLKRLVNDITDWCKILLNRREPFIPAIGHIMYSEEIQRREELIPALLPNESYHHKMDFWNEVHGLIEGYDGDGDFNLCGIMKELDTYQGCELRAESQLKAVVCPVLFQTLWNQPDVR